MIGIKDVDGIGVNDKHDCSVIFEKFSESLFTLSESFFLQFAIGDVVNNIINKRFAMDLDFFGKYFNLAHGTVGSTVRKWNMPFVLTIPFFQLTLDFFRRKNIYLIKIHQLQYLNRPPVKISCRLIRINYRAGIRIKNDHDGWIVLKHRPETLFTFFESIFHLLPIGDVFCNW